MMEPADLWVTRLDNKFKDRAPKVVENPDKPGYLFVAEGLKPFPVAGGFGAGRSGEELKDHMSKGYEAARPSGWDPVERVKDQDIDGVEAEVLYTTLGMPLFRIEDADLQRACFATYNDWVAEFSSHNPKRLYAIGLISLADIDMGVKELERIHKQGLRGAMIWGSPPEDKPYHSRIYDKFWQAAAELHMPLSLHVITGKGKESEVGERERIGVFYMNVIHEVQRSLSTLIFGGVLERFPKLTIVSAENDVAWMPYFMWRMDFAQGRIGVLGSAKLSLKPSEYVKRQVYATFINEPIFLDGVQRYAVDNAMWSSDYPHTAAIWPKSQEFVKETFSGLAEGDRRKIVHDTAARVYGITD